jgi:rhamnosyltransferase
LPFCSIIIRTYNEERHIGRLIDGIERQEVPHGTEIEIIVVDSGSTDATLSIASNREVKIVHIRKEEFSFGRALNIGCAEAKGELLLFASAHVYPLYTDWIAKMTAPFLGSEQVGLVYGRQTGNEQTRFSEQQIFFKWFPRNSNYNQQTPFCNNANCAIRRSQWLVQPFDEDITGLEDLDWANKMLSKKYKIVYEAGAVIAHIHEETPAKIKNRYMREAIALKLIMPKVHVGYLEFVRLFCYNTFSDSLRALKSGVLINEFKGIVVFRYMQFYGTYLGHSQQEVSKELKNRFYYPQSIKRKKKGEMPITHPNKSKRIEYL